MNVKKLMEMADKSMKAGSYAEAVTLYKEILTVNNDNLKAIVTMGIAEHNLGNESKAEHHYKKSIVLDPKYAETYYYLGLIKLQNDELKKSIKAFYVVYDSGHCTQSF